MTNFLVLYLGTISVVMLCECNIFGDVNLYRFQLLIPLSSLTRYHLSSYALCM